jgi:hypothetical protein
MVHVHQDGCGIQNDLMASFAFYIGDESNTARILFEGWIVKTLLFRKAYG